MHKTFFILSHGRSGSKFLALLLNDTSNDIVVNHEPFLEDYHLLPLAYYYPESKVLKSKLKNRFETILSELNNDVAIYGEVNSLLRYSAGWLIDNLSPVILHLVRDGRDVVRSTYARNTYLWNDSHLPIFPKNNDKYSDKWIQMTRFEKICWYWRETNEHLLRYNFPIIHLESLISNYDYFKNKLLIPLGISVSYDRWKEKISNPQNKTKNFDFKKIVKKYIIKENINTDKIPHYTRWDKNMLESFNEICGETMRKLGYYE